MLVQLEFSWHPGASDGVTKARSLFMSMTNRFRLVTQCLNNTIEKKAAALGYANLIMFMCSRSHTFQMRTLHFWLVPAIDHQQIVFFFDSTARPMGYVTWAYLAPDAEQRMLTDPNFLLHPSEWNEGGRTWIIDFCFPSGGAKDAISTLKKIFRENGIPQIFWARRSFDFTIKKTGRYSLSKSPTDGLCASIS